MAWRDVLNELKSELAELRSQRSRKAEDDQVEIDRQRRELTQLAGTLQVTQLLEEMNSTLLDGKGTLEKIVSWEPPEEGSEEFDLDDESVEEADVITGILSWDEGGDRELAVDLGIGDDGTYLQVNNVDIRPEREALEQALLEGFRDELEL